LLGFAEDVQAAGHVVVSLFDFAAVGQDGALQSPQRVAGFVLKIRDLVVGVFALSRFAALKIVSGKGVQRRT